MSDAVNKILKLVAETGEHCMVLDSDGQNVYVVMPLDEYQAMKTGQVPKLDKRELHDLTEEQLLNKINREIDVWKSTQNQSETVAKPLINRQKSESDKGDKFYFEPADDSK